MGLRIEYVKPSDIAGYSNNARVHSPAQVKQLVNSILEFGFTNPVLLNESGVLIAGHGRLEAARAIGMETVPAIRLAGLTDRQIKALRVADNQLALNASWDMDLLAAELSDLDSEDFSLDVLGFDDEFLNGLLNRDIDIDGSGDAPNDGVGAGNENQNVAVAVGPYEFTLNSNDWRRWETGIRAVAGFEKDAIIKEIKRRLEF